MLSIIVASDENGLIGVNNTLPWHLPADLTHFKSVTSGHKVIMGRKTFESIGRPLPNRENIVITRDETFQAEGVIVENSIEVLINKFGKKDEEVFVIGGSEIYQHFLSQCKRVYLTKINETFEGDAYFPILDQNEWEIIERVKGERDEKNPYDFDFITYQKR